MNMFMYKLTQLVILGGILLLTGCQRDDENYAPMPKRVYIVAKPAANATAFTNSASGSESVANVFAQVYVNVPYDYDVKVTFTLGGTAIPSEDYKGPTPLEVTIPAGQYRADIGFTVIDDKIKEKAETVVINLASAPEGFELGLGSAYGYKSYTYTIIDND
jgi:hypothetical protein